MNKFKNPEFVTENYGDGDLLLIHFIFYFGLLKVKFIFFTIHTNVFMGYSALIQGSIV